MPRGWAVGTCGHTVTSTGGRVWVCARPEHGWKQPVYPSNRGRQKGAPNPDQHYYRRPQTAAVPGG
jgi:hypothetical protein